jgi:predicted Zn-dependent protease with MMP-like domain
VRAHGSADLGLGVAAHERTLQRAGESPQRITASKPAVTIGAGRRRH